MTKPHHHGAHRSEKEREDARQRRLMRQRKRERDAKKINTREDRG